MMIIPPATTAGRCARVRWQNFPSLDDNGRVLALVSGRHGGVSEGGFESLNLGLTVGDEPTRVHENRRRLFDAVAIDPRRVSYVRQVHGERVVDGTPGPFPSAAPGAAVDADAQMTDRPDVALFLTFADCVPLLVHDPRRRAIGLGHAGWRGTLAGVGCRLVEGMRARFGCRPADLRVALGPSIGPCCYRVGDDLAHQFRDRWPGRSDVVISHATQSAVDLWAANCRQFAAAGVPVENIQLAGICTACRVDDYFSHRRQAGAAGRFAAVIALR